VKFSEIVEHAGALLQRAGRITYRALKREFALDDEMLADLREELITARRIAVDEDDKVLVWTGAAPVPSSKFQVPSQDFELRTLNPELSPVTYTPPHLAERIRAEQAALEARGVSDGERKTITALFADLKGSTALIEGLDPEEARAIIDPALQIMMDAVHRYEGYVAQALGDGIFALFGAPIAREDHPQRALYAALRMQEEMRRYGDSLRPKGYPPLLMRVGVNTGEVVVRSIRKDDLHTDYVPVGHSTNLAARMEQLAAPGSILVTAYTYKLTEGYFAFRDLGQTQIKGVEELLNVYEVLGAGPLRTRLQVAARRGLTRFVGRQREMEQMQRTLTQARASHGQVVGVMGEPGLGKSRLFYEFVGAYCNTPLHAHSPYLVLQAYSVSYGKASPYLPVIELLKSYFDIQSQDDERKRREKVGGKVLMLDRSLEDTLPYLFALLGIEEQPSPLQQMDPQIRRRRTFEALKKLFLRESLNQPLVLIFEDLHWIDSETQGFLDTLSEGVASAKVLLLVNYRPEYRHEWGSKTYYTQLRLAPFGQAEAEEFLTVLLGDEGGATGRSPLQALKQLILEKTEGTPFFMEEIVQELVEQGVLVRESGVGVVLRDRPQEGAPIGAPLHIPATVQGVLAARIDRLAPDEKALLQQLAVIGREFPLSLVRQVLSLPEDDLYRLLSALQHKEFLYEQPAFPEVEYIFKHAFTQEVAYGTVLQERRKALHERTGQALETVYAAKLSEHYTDLAHHYSRSGNRQKAVEYLGLAGQQAVQQSANAEAINHLTTALELLKTLPDTPERTQHELTLQILLGVPLIATKGHAAPEVKQVYMRTRELCQQGGEPPQLFAALWGLYLSSLLRAEYETTQELGEQLLGLAQSMPDLAPLVHYAVGVPLFFLGEPAPGRVHFEQGIALYDPQQHRSYGFRYGQDPGVTCLCLTAMALYLLGYPAQALKRTHEAVTLAHEVAHPFSLGWALAWSAIHHQFRREGRLAQGQAEAAIIFSTEQGFPIWVAISTVIRGWALAEQGQGKEGITQIRQGIVAYAATGAEVWLGAFASLAEAYGKAGQAEEGLSVLAEALATVNKTGERWYEAELYRLAGELSLRMGERETGRTGEEKIAHSPIHPFAHSSPEECFLKAIAIAQKQQAKSLELRAVMSLVRLRQQQATQDASRTTQHATRTKLDEAHKLLSDVYNWFTEGFETKDLQEAKTLIEELNH
jgi:class 3 adenylate cyclase/predicted ATPase